MEKYSEYNERILQAVKGKIRKPKNGDAYWTIGPCDGGYRVWMMTWEGSYADYDSLAKRLCFTSYEEAAQELPRYQNAYDSIFRSESNE